MLGQKGLPLPLTYYLQLCLFWQVGLVCCQGIPDGSCTTSAYKDYQVVFQKASLQKILSHWVLISQDTMFVSADFHTFPIGPFLQIIEIPLESSPGPRLIDPTLQVWCHLQTLWSSIPLLPPDHKEGKQDMSQEQSLKSSTFYCCPGSVWPINNSPLSPVIQPF